MGNKRELKKTVLPAVQRVYTAAGPEKRRGKGAFCPPAA